MTRTVLTALLCGQLVLTCCDAALKDHLAPPADYLQGASPWVASRFPHPGFDTKQCQTKSLRSCDPDGVFSKGDWKEIDTALQVSQQILLSCSPAAGNEESCGSGEEEEDTTVEVQIAVAVMRKMDLTEYRGYEDPQGSMAESFAQHLHDAWGVGVPTSCGGTGVLFLLSDLDRRVYISRGDALRDVLADRRLDRTICNMKPLLHQQKYKEAILQGLNEITFLIHYGKPRLYERITDFVVAYIGIISVVLIFGVALWSGIKERESRRRYAQATVCLDEIDRARAEALQGNFQMDSCPFCLERFPNELGSKARPTRGSDEQPLKLLRCGHVFDASCWADWMAKGRGQIDKCPICQQSIARDPRVERLPDRVQHGGDGGASTIQDSPLDIEPADDPTNGHDDASDTVDTSGAAARGTRATPGSADGALNNLSVIVPREADAATGVHRALSRYQQERNFRLARLAVRFPRFVSVQMVQDWTQTTYDGPLARDPSFVRNDPSERPVHSRHRKSAGQTKRRSFRGTSSGSSTFSGGTSGGGRGGSW